MVDPGPGSTLNVPSGRPHSYEEVGERERGERRLRRGFHHGGVAARQRRRDLPRRDDRREVPRRDECADADRLAQRDVDTGRHDRDRLADDLVRGAAPVLEHVRRRCRSRRAPTRWVCPPLRASSRARSSWRSRISSDAFVSSRPRSRALMRAPGPSSKARLATSTARRASSGDLLRPPPPWARPSRARSRRTSCRPPRARVRRPAPTGRSSPSLHVAAAALMPRGGRSVARPATMIAPSQKASMCRLGNRFSDQMQLLRRLELPVVEEQLEPLGLVGLEPMRSARAAPAARWPSCCRGARWPHRGRSARVRPARRADRAISRGSRRWRSRTPPTSAPATTFTTDTLARGA